MKKTAPDGDFLIKKLNQSNGGNLFSHGTQAFDHIPGLKVQYVKGVLLTLILAAVLFYIQFVFIYNPFIAPFVESYAEKINSWWSWFSYLTTPILWLIKIICWVIMMVAAIKTATTCMGFWIDTILEKVIRHYRDIPDSPFSIGKFFKSTSRSLILTSKNLVFSIIFLVLGFIPLLGILFGFVGVACTNGFDIVSPYILILSEHDDDILYKFKMDKFQTFKAGWVQALLTYIPIVGWAFIPFILLLQVIGYAHFIESSWQRELKQLGEKSEG